MTFDAVRRLYREGACLKVWLRRGEHARDRWGGGAKEILCGTYSLQFCNLSLFSVFSCLHEWQPHDGEPVTALFFCDNHLTQEEGSSWRFLITGAKYNTELKVWCSVSWKCLQVLR